MAEDGELSTKLVQKTQETFQRAQEAPSEHRFPARTGIVNVPRGSRGPRSLYIARRDDSFGFTLRHFIVYPPEPTESDARHPSVDVQLQPMETIFVRNVAEGGPAELAGLKCGDRLVAVNGKSVTDKSYSQVIQLIQRSPEYLHLLVISKDEDVLQKFYTNIAYNPASNQPSTKERHGDRKRLVHQEAINPRRCSEFQADAISWRSLQNPSYSSLEYGQLKPKHPKQEQRSADNILNTSRDALRNQPKSFEVYTKPVLHESYQRPRAQPQVPMHRKMGRRASEGSTFAERDIYQNYHLTGQANEMVVGENMKTSKNPYMSEQASHPSLEMPVLSYPTSAGCRLSLDAGRRDSSSSLTSSLADGSKDSLNSYDSSSTMTGYDLDNPDISKIIKRFQQKEEFLKSGKAPENSLIQREFYSRPKKLEKQVWPPFEPRQESPSRTNKPTHQNFQRVKNDIEIERDYIQSNEPKQMPMQKIAGAPRDWSLVNNHHKPREASPPPNLQIQQMNGSAITADFEEKRNCPPQGLQIVSRRARQFETGRPLPEDDPLLNDRTSFYRSELARLSAKRVVPNVTVRAREFETRSSEPRRDTSTSSANSASTNVRKTHQDSRSLDSSGSNASVSSLCENVNTKLSGNYTVPVGSKYIHVPVPKDYQPDKDVSNIDNLPNRIRVRSNSADSWVASSQGTKPEDNESLGHGMNVTTKRDRSLQEAMDTFPVSQNSGDLSPLIPEPVAQMQLTPSVSITPAPTHPQKSAIRPTQLDLNAPKRPARHLRPPSDLVETPPPRSGSPVIENRPVVMRRTKNTNIAEEERAMRRESYLKATEGGRMHFDSDQSDGDVSPQVLRSSSVSGGSSSSVSLEREKRPGSPTDKEKYNIIKEGHLHCKVTEIDGKRSADRSWKQIWVVLKGPKLYLYKDRHHQSPVGTSDVVEQSLASGVDMRASCVRVAEDYTKRKHVLRVSSVKPCRSELLLQADNTVDLADWVRALQEQVAASTDVEGKLEQALSTQQAVPQTIPASTSIQVQGSSRLSPQPHKSKLPNLRNRSPTGQSPVSKTRKPPSQSHEASATSPKSKTWRGRVAKQFRKIQGASSPSSPTAPEGYTFGIPLEQCIPSNNNQFVPKLVEECTKIVENKGLEVVGIYRVPGNNAAVTALTDEVNRNEELPFTDQRWNDVHVVSSLLKSFFRKMPDSLLTTVLYPSFIEADKIESAVARMNKIKELVKNLPPHHYNTLKHLILHLRNVVEHSEGNKMEARNLAIVFGPTIVRAGEESMEMMVNDMTHQCKIVESLVSHADWFFDESNVIELNLCAPIASTEVVSASDAEQLNTAVLLDNIGKIEGFRDKEQKEKKEFIQSLFSAAQRKVKRKTAKSLSSSQDSKEEVVTSNSLKDTSGQSYDMIDSKENVIEHKNSNVPTTVTELDKSTRPWYNYKTDREKIDQRIKNFIQETEANMKIPRKSVLSSNHSLERKHPGVISSSASNVNQNTQMSVTTHSVDPRTITKTHSASNVFSRTTNSDNTGRNSLSSADNYKVQYSSNFNNKYNVYGDYANSEQNRQLDNISDFHVYKSSYSDLSTSSDSRNYKPAGYGLRKGNSAENINSSSLDLNGNTSMKKIKYDESDLSQRTGSLDSLHKADEDDLLKTMTKIFDEKLPLRFELDSIPYADESPEKLIRENLHLNKEHNIPSSPKLYRNPSLHKSQYTQAKLSIPTQLNKESKLKEYNDKVDKEKDEDSTMVHDENMPDNERHIPNQNKLAINRSNGNVKLKRSESLNKPERTVSPLNVKLKRSESLNKASNDKLKRSDSLTKTEKTESNISKRRELSSSSRRANKEFIVKLKRKNGMPERSIKRRHTVGGTKDPDKVTWLDNCYQEEDMSVKESIKEKNSLRTSSPDLSSTRRERLLLQVNLIAPQDMVAALRHHLIGARPQSFPEAAVYKVPLESHV